MFVTHYGILKGDTFKLGILFEYVNTKEAFQNTIEYLDKHFNTLMEKTKELMTMAKMEGSRGCFQFVEV